VKSAQKYKNILIDSRLDAKQRRRQLVAPLAMAGIFLIPIGIAFLNADAAKLSWWLIMPATLYANRK
jgi:hypothetical protein